MELEVQIQEVLKCLPRDLADCTLPDRGKCCVEELPEQCRTDTRCAVCSLAVDVREKHGNSSWHKRTTRYKRPDYYPHGGSRSEVHVQRVNNLLKYQRYLDVQ